MELTVLNPDVNQSYLEFAVVPAAKQIRFGMAAVKGVGVAAVEEIIRAPESIKAIFEFTKNLRVIRRQYNLYIIVFLY